MPSKEQFMALGMNSARFKPTPGQADLIKNLVVTGDGTLKSITGPTLYEPRETWSTFPVDLGQVHSGWHGYFNSGEKEVLIVHAGTNLWCHWGAIRGWVALSTPRAIRNDSEIGTQFVPFNNGLIFLDGLGPPIFITHQLDTLTMGFPDEPSTPVVRGPSSPNQNETDIADEGFYGYSWHGGIGSPGDRLNGERSHILRTEVMYRIQLESFQGDLSPMSVNSMTVEYGPKKTKASDRNVARNGTTTTTNILTSGQTLKDLMRGVAVVNSDELPDNTKYIRVLRTKDVNRNDNTFYVAWKIPVGGAAMHDWRFDSGLTQKAPDIVRVPFATCGVMYGGSFAVIDGEKVRLSQPNFPGTFERNSWVNITPDGRQGTAIFTLNGKLFAATDTSIVDCTDFKRPVTISASTGIESQQSFCYAPGLGIVFVSKQGVFALDAPGGVAQITKLSNDIDYMWRTDINKARLNRAVLWYSSEYGEVRIALSNKGMINNRRVLAFSAEGWREHDFGVDINCAFLIEDMEVVGGTDGRTMSGQYTPHDIYVLERESQVYTPPARNSVYESDWMAIDDQLGVVRSQVLTLMLGFAETYGLLSCTVEVLRNYDNGAVSTEKVYLKDVNGDPEAVEEGTDRNVEWATAINNTDTWQQRRVFWRQTKLNIEDAQRFKVRITTAYPNVMELIAMLYTYDVPQQVQMREPDFQEQ